MRPQTPPLLLRLGALYLMIQSLGASLWWLALWLFPATRVYFRPANAPDAVLIAFFLPGLVGFIGAAMWAAWLLWRAPKRALLPLAIHVGAASYAAFYCLQQWMMTGEAALAALAMTPSLVIGPLLLRKLCLYLRD